MINPVSPLTQMPTVPHTPISQSQLAPVSGDYPMPVTPIATSTGTGLDTKYVSCTASTNATVVKAAPGKAYKIKAFNNGSVPVFLKLYNMATTPNPASDTVFDKYEIVSGIGGAGFVDDIDLGQEFSTGIAFAVTANFGDTDNTAIGAGVVSVSILYK